MITTKAGRILVIDDEAIVRDVVQRALARAYDVRTLKAPDELDALASFQPDLIVLDVRMPLEDGWHLCARLRQEKRFDTVPIVFLSGLSDAESMRKGFASGGDYYLAKPFNINDLLHVIGIFLGRKHVYPNEVFESRRL